MLSRENYSKEYIESLYRKTGCDPSILERVVFAFGLLEALVLVGLPFTFKGGTSLMLLLKTPKRLSTDIDIVVSPNVEIDGYIAKAGEIFPFVEVKENLRRGRNDIVKRHFRFTYHSPLSERDLSILLDVVFEDQQYLRLEKRPIRSDLLLTEGEDVRVTLPSVDDIFGDKLTAFAPHTTGIRFGEGKELEIVKQLFDCSVLFDEMTDFSNVKDAYTNVVEKEMAYRGLNIDAKEVLYDSIQGCVCIASRGSVGRDYGYYKDGVSRIRNHIIGGRFNGEIAGACACKVLFLLTAIIAEKDGLSSISKVSDYAERPIMATKPKAFSYLKVIDLHSYAYAVEALQSLSEIGILF